MVIKSAYKCIIKRSLNLKNYELSLRKTRVVSYMNNFIL